MHGENIQFAYGFWSLVVVNVVLFAFFILSFLTPVKKREWRSMGVTLITALMFPVLIFVYYRLSKREEGEMIKAFGEEYRQYMNKTPMFIPHLSKKEVAV